MQRLDNTGYQRVDADDEADIYIINSCTVTTEADRQSRQMARRLKRRNENALVIMTGCYAQNNSEAVAGIDAIDWVVGNAAKLDIPALIVAQEEKASKGRQVVRPEFDQLLSLPEDLLAGYDSQSRAFIQIQQGCDQSCTFCIIHVARGPSVSFPVQMVLAQYQRIVAQGYREVVICGVDLGAYGDDLGNGHSLERLLYEMLALGLDCRIRISSIDPWHLSPELIALIAHSDALCPQLHLSLQSANDMVLKRMKRRASRELVFERVALLREALPDLVLSADILVGFPTETQDQFADTLAAVEALQIAYPHVFPYSARTGTPAARIPAQVKPDEKKRRARLVRELGREVWIKQAQTRLATVQRSIIESTGQDGCPLARCDDYFPVKLSADFALPDAGQWCQVKITGIEGQSLLGERVACD